MSGHSRVKWIQVSRIGESTSSSVALNAPSLFIILGVSHEDVHYLSISG